MRGIGSDGRGPYREQTALDMALFGALLLAGSAAALVVVAGPLIGAIWLIKKLAGL